MAHTCPVCGQTCYCNGDIDDIILNTEEAVAKCTHCSEYEDDSSQCDYCDAAVRADKAERERDEAQAGAAQMRGALELLWGATRPVVLGTINTCGLKDVDTACTCETPCDEIVALKVVPEALESTAGRDFLKRLERAEDFLHEIDTDEDGECLGFTLHAIRQYLKEMNGKIALSEAQKQREELLQHHNEAEGLLEELRSTLKCPQRQDHHSGAIFLRERCPGCSTAPFCQIHRLDCAIDAYLKRGERHG